MDRRAGKDVGLFVANDRVVEGIPDVPNRPTKHTHITV